jgi:hypothetical protein
VRFFIFTDIPVWVRPLARALEACGADVRVSDCPETIRPQDAVVNRISTRVARWAKESRRVVNGADCLELGFSKWAQAELMRHCGVRTPRTEIAQAGRRHISDQPILLKPAAGGFGHGIRRLEAGEPVPDDLEGDRPDEWVEQAILEPADGAVHRVETLGGKALYEAVSPVTPDCFDYCLAHATPQVVLKRGTELTGAIARAVGEITSHATMELGSLEYLLDAEGRPWFIDLNPVSSLHPEAKAVLGRDPMDLIADYLCARAAPQE